MISGRLRDRVEIWRFTSEADDIGYPVETWKKIADVWGTFQQERGSEVLKNDRPMDQKSALLFIRYRSDVNSKDRIKVRGTTWEVEAVREIENMRRREGLELILRLNE